MVIGEIERTEEICWLIDDVEVVEEVPTKAEAYLWESIKLLVNGDPNPRFLRRANGR